LIKWLIPNLRTRQPIEAEIVETVETVETEENEEALVEEAEVVAEVEEDLEVLLVDDRREVLKRMIFRAGFL